MVRKLEIVDFGLIASAEIEFAQGATVFTGETGSGKTMILGALNCALGARAGADVVRRGSSRARVSLTFEPDERLRARFTTDGFEIDPGEDATIVREMTDSGKSSVRVNGRASTASYVREIAAEIAEIVGQHEAQRLLLPTYHLELLDRFGGKDATLARREVAASYSSLLDAQRRYDSVAGDEVKAKQRYDEAREALLEIEALAPKPGEDEQLRERRSYLDNVERIASSLQLAHDALSGDDAGAANPLGAASSSLNALVDVGSKFQKMYESLNLLQSDLAELATEISRELEATEFDPGEHEAISARLDAIDRAKRKYGATIEAILAHAEAARAIVDDFEMKDQLGAELAKAVKDARTQLTSAASRLTKIRAAAGKKLSAAVMSELKDLALASATFEVTFAPVVPIGGEGAESVEFAFSANAGEPLRPLSRVASGGELSRLLLALIVALAATRDPGALVFDEIDAGIGGATATAVGVRLGRLARDGQVVAVTHLAQLATYANRHYVLDKHESKGTTTISVREIAGDEPRATELARMLSGESHDAALEHARTLLRSAK